MVPKGWKYVDLEAVAPIIDCKHRTPKYSDSGYPIVSPGNITWGNLQLENCRRISEIEFGTMMDHCIVDIGDLIFGRNQTVGVAARVVTDEPFALGQDTVLIKPRKIDSRFLQAFLQSQATKRQIYKLLGGSTFGRINLKDLRQLKVTLPERREQKRIAEILSTWDKAIETTVKLIANAEAQKKALMQQLLTGKKRLPGFKGEWEVTTLCSVAEILISNVDKKNIEGEELVKLCNYMDVYKNNIIESDGNYMRSTASIHQIKKFQLKVGDVIITKDSERPDDIANSSYVKSTDDNFVCGYHLAIIRPNNDIVGRYLKYYFEDPCTKHFFTSRANGVTRFGLTIPTIKSAPIRLPNSVEQQKIATILSDCELHIRQLVNNINQLKTEKAALMQQLLTGKRRVKVEEPAT